jgi:cyclohexanone monooxygenase
VTLVDTRGRGVERITETGVVAAGRLHEVDCLIYATGFEVGTAYTRRAGCELFGRGGLRLSQKWAPGVATLHGVQTRGFPNCFFLSPAQAGFTANFPHLLQQQSLHVAYIVAHAVQNGLREVEVSAEAEAQWVADVVRLSQMNLDFFEQCTPGYYNNEGKPAERSGQNGFYGGGPVEYFRILREWRERGDLAGLELR